MIETTMSETKKQSTVDDAAIDLAETTTQKNSSFFHFISDLNPFALMSSDTPNLLLTNVKLRKKIMNNGRSLFLMP